MTSQEDQRDPLDPESDAMRRIRLARELAERAARGEVPPDDDSD